MRKLIVKDITEGKYTLQDIKTKITYEFYLTFYDIEEPVEVGDYIGYGENGNAQMASTMAFATICLSRLLHGFNCRSNQPLHQIGFFSNKMSILAFVTGFALLHIILFVPVLHGIFEVGQLDITKLLMVYGFAIVSTIVIQLKKILFK